MPKRSVMQVGMQQGGPRGGAGARWLALVVMEGDGKTARQRRSNTGKLTGCRASNQRVQRGGMRREDAAARTVGPALAPNERCGRGHDEGSTARNHPHHPKREHLRSTPPPSRALANRGSPRRASPPTSVGPTSTNLTKKQKNECGRAGGRTLASPARSTILASPQHARPPGACTPGAATGVSGPPQPGRGRPGVAASDTIFRAKPARGYGKGRGDRRGRLQAPLPAPRVACWSLAVDTSGKGRGGCQRRARQQAVASRLSASATLYNILCGHSALIGV